MATSSRRRTLPEILIELRSDDPEFRQAITARGYRTGQVVAESSALNQNLCALIKGRVQLVHQGPHSRRLALATLNPGAVFGEGALSGGEDPSVKAIALSDCIVWSLPVARAEELMERYPILSWAMLQTIGDRLAQAENHMEEVAYRRLPARLASLLLELAGGSQLIQGITHQRLANMLGTYRETVSAILRQFEDAGWVELGYRRIEVRDTTALHATTGRLEEERSSHFMH